MPIRFYCVYCNRQLGIATRKAGAVVTCPSCKQQLRVPTPEDVGASEAPPATHEPTPTEAVSRAGTAPTPPGHFFEASDFDEFLRPAAPPTPPPPNGAAPLPPVELPGDQPMMISDAAPRSGRWGLIALSLVMFGVGFAAGFFVARSME